MIVSIVVIILTVVLLTVGLIGSIVPVIPGPLLILIGAFVYAWHTGFTTVNWAIIGILAFLALLSQGLDYLATVIGAKKFGASRWGMFGAFLGGIIGLFAGIVGIIIGPFIGAFLLELFRGKSINSSVKIGFGTLIGFLGGTIGRFVIAVIMVVIFCVRIIA